MSGMTVNWEGFKAASSNLGKRMSKTRIANKGKNQPGTMPHLTNHQSMNPGVAERLAQQRAVPSLRTITF